MPLVLILHRKGTRNEHSNALVSHEGARRAPRQRQRPPRVASHAPADRGAVHSGPVRICRGHVHRGGQPRRLVWHARLAARPRAVRRRLRRRGAVARGHVVVPRPRRHRDGRPRRLGIVLDRLRHPLGLDGDRHGPDAAALVPRAGARLVVLRAGHHHVLLHARGARRRARSLRRARPAHDRIGDPRVGPDRRQPHVRQGRRVGARRVGCRGVVHRNGVDARRRRPIGRSSRSSSGRDTLTRLRRRARSTSRGPSPESSTDSERA